MNFKNFNSWIFLICTLILLITNQSVKSKIIYIPIYILAILGIIYSLYTSEIKKKTKFILIGLYLLSLILYIIK